MRNKVIIIITCDVSALRQVTENNMHLLLVCILLSKIHYELHTVCLTGDFVVGFCLMVGAAYAGNGGGTTDEIRRHDMATVPSTGRRPSVGRPHVWISYFNSHFEN